MARTQAAKTSYDDPPQTLARHPFYGLKLDKEQVALRDAIWDDKIEFVAVDAKAGSGKTLISVATSVLMYRYHRIDSICYVVNAVGDMQGFLPGTISEKSSVYLEPLYQALISCNEFPEKVIRNESMTDKTGEGFITAITSTYLRGSNIGGSGKSVLIIDEAQNFTEFELRKVITRACEGTKVILIGHQLQCDLRNPRQSGFASCMRHFKSKADPRFAFCELYTCHRSLIAQVADEPWDEDEFGKGGE